MTSPPATAAYFDFDRTVVDGDAGVLFGRELIRIRRRRVLDEGRGTVAWASRVLMHEAATAALFTWAAGLGAATKVGLVKRSHLVRLAYQKMSGLRLEDLRELAADYFHDVLSHRLFPDARREMERHRAERRRVVVVSTGMHLVIDPVKQYLPVDDVIAVTLHEKGGRLDGRVTGPLWGGDKAAWVRDYAHRHRLSLPRSYAYTDHHSDLEFLQLVGHPVAVNPDLRLRLHALGRGWPVARWRRTDSKSLSAASR